VAGIRFFDPTSADPRKRSLLYTAAFCALALAVELWAVSSPGAYGEDPSFYPLWLLATLCGAMALLLRGWPAHAAGAAGAPPARSKASETAAASGAEDDLAAWKVTRARIMGQRTQSSRVVMDSPKGAQFLEVGRRIVRASFMQDIVPPAAAKAQPKPAETPPADDTTALDDLGAWRSRRARGFSDYDMNMPAEPLPSAPQEHRSGPDTTRAKKEHKPFDPWAKVLEEMDSRDRK
jgi:hypothetical protein